MSERSQSSPTAAMLIIGNEILSGRTQDKNVAHVAQRLGSRGIALAEVRVVPDIEQRIVDAVNQLRAEYDLVFTSGGIGPTHDDITADCIARAVGVDLVIDPEARRRLAALCEERGIELNADRLRMARVPRGGSLIDNPVSAAPGFVIENIHVMAGVPRILQAMLEYLLPTLPQGVIVDSVSVIADGIGEGDIASDLRELQTRWPAVDIGSYPGKVEGRSRIELVARSSDSDALASVQDALESLIAAYVSDRE